MFANDQALSEDEDSDRENFDHVEDSERRNYEEESDDFAFGVSGPSGDQEPVEGTDGDILFFEEPSDDDEDEESDEEVSHINDVFIANGITYTELSFPTRNQDRNILRERSAISAHPRRAIESFLLFITEDMLRTIQRHTNRKVHDVRRTVRRIHSYMSLFTYDEIKACLGIVLMAGVHRDNFTDLQDLWDPIDGRPFFRAVMSLLRFRFFLRVVRFDNYRTRPMRLNEGDRLAAISEIWNQFNHQLRQFYRPKEILTVDEQLLGYRGKIPGRTYIPSKPRKYGLKIFWICEADSGYALKASIYTGRINNEIHRDLAKHVVLDLCEPFYGSGRGIVTDNFFTSHSLATALLEKRLTLLGTMRSHRKEIPEILRDRKRPVESSKFLFDHENKIVIVSYMAKKNKNVILLSSSHSGSKTLPHHANKPELVLDYNFGKKGVDTMDEAVEEFTCRRKTVRWPLLLFFNMLDIAAFDAYILMKADGFTSSRKKFLRNLAFELAEEYAKMRFEKNPYLSKNIKNAASLLGLLPERPLQSRDSSSNVVGRCENCGRTCRSQCNDCGVHVCPSHRQLVKRCLCSVCAI